MEKNKLVKYNHSNPNKANQYRVDPRQALFLKFYLDPKSPTFSNGLQSALKCGYAQKYAEVLVTEMPTWLEEKVKHSHMLAKAERNLDEALDLETKQQVVTVLGIVKDSNGNPIERENAGLLKVKMDISKFIAERIGKKVYSENKSEIERPAPILNMFIKGNVNVLTKDKALEG